VDRVKRRRLRARESGLCTRCCVELPPPGLSVCQACKDKIGEYRKKRHGSDRNRRYLQQIIENHERAGDLSRDHHLCEDAAGHYQDALKVRTIDPVDRSRISEKLAHVLFLGRDPNAATPLFDHALASHVDKPREAAKTVGILLQQARQLWVDARSWEALPLLAQAVQICETHDDLYLRKLAYGKMAQYFLGLACLREAESLLDAVGDVSDENAAVRATFYTQRAIIAAAFGNAAGAFDHFDRAVNAAKEDGDIFYLTCVWNVYGFWAMALGRIELAKACDERALLVAREHHIVWRIPDLCLEYAGILAKIGQQGLAYEYVLNASAYGTLAPTTIMLFASVGIPLALRMKDEAMLAQCARPSAIDLAFRSRYPAEIGPVAAAFAHLYGVSGRRHEAEALLHRALEALAM